MADDFWALLRCGKTPEGLSHMQEVYRTDSGTSEAMELGVAYLWLQEYEKAYQHFQTFNEKYPLHSSVTYAMAGTAKWCMDQPIDAVKCWKIGLNSEFSDTAGLGFKLPLLLYFTSVVRPNILPASEAMLLLSAKSDDSRAKGWGGSLARFVQGKINEDELRKECPGRHDDETILHHWVADFYVAVVAHANRNEIRYLDLMRRVASLSWSDYDSNNRAFLSKLWSGEFFLARHELKRAPHNPIH
jgi:hypothetical protein